MKKIKESKIDLNDQALNLNMQETEKGKSKYFFDSRAHPSVRDGPDCCLKMDAANNSNRIKTKRRLLNPSYSIGFFDQPFGNEQKAGACSVDDKEFQGWDFKKTYSHGLFTSSIDAVPLSFVLSLKNIKLRNELNILIPDCGGRVEVDKGNIGPHSVVIVDDESNCWFQTGDVFKVSYIQDCLKEQHIIDISPYRKNSRSNLVDGFDYMKIFYFHKYTWSTIPANYILNVENSSGDEIFKVSAESPKKNTRALYSVKERELIVKHIVEYSGYSKLKGREFWMQMEKRRICPIRTWQSMKEHFMKHISKRLAVYSFLSEEQKRRLKEMN